MWRSGCSTTAAATTGPARQPRPTSSQPATYTNPMRRSAFSRVRYARVFTFRFYAGVCFLPVSFMRAALPFSSRRKYSLARRTFAVRSTSILSMIGECSGKMRSTPWPNDTLRTVNVARAPPRCIPITMPSNTWMRSLSPSRTLTCTRTVSPGLIAGRWVSCPRSTVSTAVMTLLPFLLQQIRTVGACALERLLPPPLFNLFVVPRQQHGGHDMAAELSGTGVLRKIQQPARERVARDRRLVTHHPGNQSRDRVENHQRGEFASRQHVIAD